MRILISAVFTLAALCALGLVNWQMARSPVNIVPIPANAQPQESPTANASGETLRLPAISLFQASQRPLFAPDRRTWTPPAQPAIAPAMEMQSQTPVAQPAPPPAITLLGIQKSPSGSTVLLNAAAGTVPIWVKEGEVYESWRVRNINPASVELTSGSSILTLELYPVTQTGPTLP